MIRAANCYQQWFTIPNFSQRLFIPSSNADTSLDSWARRVWKSCVCALLILYKDHSFSVPWAISFSDSLLLSTSWNFTLQPQIPVPRHEPVYWNMGSCLGTDRQSDVWRQLVNSHVSKRPIKFRELKGLFLWLNTGNAISFLFTNLSIISW